MNKHTARQRRGLKSKAIIKQGNRPRLVVFRSAANIYAQVVQAGEKGDVVIASASTVDNELKKSLKGDKKEKAAQVGALIAKRAKAKDITDVAFDRAGFMYHGRVKALADGAREAGLNF